MFADMLLSSLVERIIENWSRPQRGPLSLDCKWKPSVSKSTMKFSSPQGVFSQMELCRICGSVRKWCTWCITASECLWRWSITCNRWKCLQMIHVSFFQCYGDWRMLVTLFLLWHIVKISCREDNWKSIMCTKRTSESRLQMNIQHYIVNNEI